MSERASEVGRGSGWAVRPARFAVAWFVCLSLGGCPAFGYGDSFSQSGSGSPSMDAHADGSSLTGDAEVSDGGDLDGTTFDADVSDGAREDDATQPPSDGQMPDATPPEDAGMPDADATLTDANVDGDADVEVDASALDASPDADADVDAATDAGDSDSAVPCPASCETGSVCQAGECTPVTCASGFAECDGESDLSCETNISSDVDNCGECGEVCSDAAGEAVCVAGECDTICDFTGTFALKLTLQTNWEMTGEIDADSGTFDFWMRVRATHTGNAVTASIRECGETVPPIHAFRSNDDLLTYYPDSIFDSPILPEVAARFTLGDSSPDAAMSMPTVASQLGVSLDDPLNDTWPSTPDDVLDSMRVDHDQDGNPGVTSLYSTDGPYVHARTSGNAVFYNRARAIFIAARRTFSLNGYFTSCTQANGSATFGRLDRHILGCIRSNGNPCTATEALFLDANAPEYTPTAASYVLTKIGDDADCAGVRAALP